MKTVIEISDYDPKIGMQFKWEDNFRIECKKSVYNSNTFIIKANEAGLKSLANHILTLSQYSIPSGYDFHLDDSNGLEKGSCELIFEKE
jgi:hypothetical protein